MAEILLTPLGTNVQNDLSSAFIGHVTMNGVDKPIGWAALIKPASNATSTSLFWEMRDATAGETEASGYISVADWNSQWGTPDANGYKLVSFISPGATWNTPAQGDYEILAFNGQAAGQWYLKTGAVANQTFQLTTPVPEPGTLIFSGLCAAALFATALFKRKRLKAA